MNLQMGPRRGWRTSPNPCGCRRTGEDQGTTFTLIVSLALAWDPGSLGSLPWIRERLLHPAALRVSGVAFHCKRSLSLFAAEKPHSGEWKGLRKNYKNNVNLQKCTLQYLANKIYLSGLAKHGLRGELRGVQDGNVEEISESSLVWWKTA